MKDVKESMCFPETWHLLEWIGRNFYQLASLEEISI